jgi:hypothetical protein
VRLAVKLLQLLDETQDRSKKIGANGGLGLPIQSPVSALLDSWDDPPS